MYSEEVGDLMQYRGDEAAPVWKLCPTNGSVNDKGLAVMGAGVAKLLADEWPDVKYLLGVRLAGSDSLPLGLNILGIHNGALWFAYPTKYKWTDAKASAALIRNTCWQLDLLLSRQVIRPLVVTPKLGCGCGKLCWNKVKPLFQNLGKRHDVLVLSTYK